MPYKGPLAPFVYQLVGGLPRRCRRATRMTFLSRRKRLNYSSADAASSSLPWTIASSEPGLDPGRVERRQDAERLVVDRRRHLRDAHLAAGVVDDDQVGEGAADVDAGDACEGPTASHRPLEARWVRCSGVQHQRLHAAVEADRPSR